MRYPNPLKGIYRGIYDPLNRAHLGHLINNPLKGLYRGPEFLHSLLRTQRRCVASQSVSGVGVSW